MLNIKQMLEKAEAEGFENENAESKVCQDIVLLALSKSSLSRNVTIKGGVVMRSISGNVRRATQDMDIDFIRYSFGDDSINAFIQKLNCLDGIHIVRIGEIEELKQQDYHGKRIFVTISDDGGNEIESKIDLGVHKNLSIEQEDYCFDISSFDDGANLLINSREQMFTEKLRSLLKFGRFSTRHKDVYDLAYLTDFMDKDKLMKCIDEYIIEDSGMYENSIEDICKRVSKTFKNRIYVRAVNSSRKNWLDITTEEAFGKIEKYLESLR